MYADLDKLIVRNGKYFVLDSFGARTVVSFTKNGDPLGKYGNVGQIPANMSCPWIWMWIVREYISSMRELKTTEI